MMVLVIYGFYSVLVKKNPSIWPGFHLCPTLITGNTGRLRIGLVIVFRTYSWFSLTWWDGHVSVQSNGKMSLTFCIIIEWKSQKIFFSIVLYPNMAAVTSHENRELLEKRAPISNKLLRLRSLFVSQVKTMPLWI